MPPDSDYVLHQPKEEGTTSKERREEKEEAIKGEIKKEKECGDKSGVKKEETVLLLITGSKTVVCNTEYDYRDILSNEDKKDPSIVTSIIWYGQRKLKNKDSWIVPGGIVMYRDKPATNYRYLGQIKEIELLEARTPFNPIKLNLILEKQDIDIDYSTEKYVGYGCYQKRAFRSLGLDFPALLCQGIYKIEYPFGNKNKI